MVWDSNLVAQSVTSLRIQWLASPISVRTLHQNVIHEPEHFPNPCNRPNFAGRGPF